MKMECGQIIDGKVIRITAFGAFVELEKGISGLVHISQIADSYVEDINQVLSVNDVVKVKIISKDDSGKIGLSIKQAKEKKAFVPPPEYICEEKDNNDKFEDKLAKFMKDSNEKQNFLKKHMETKK